eukprot:scaffold57895_cov62-Phaeocystis_antarctica.AAC.5
MHRARPRLVELITVAHALRQPPPLGTAVALHPELLVQSGRGRGGCARHRLCLGLGRRPGTAADVRRRLELEVPRNLGMRAEALAAWVEEVPVGIAGESALAPGLGISAPAIDHVARAAAALEPHPHCYSEGAWRRQRRRGCPAAPRRGACQPRTRPASPNRPPAAVAWAERHSHCSRLGRRALPGHRRRRAVTTEPRPLASTSTGVEAWEPPPQALPASSRRAPQSACATGASRNQTQGSAGAAQRMH